jgi:hypothetical protein
MQLEVDREAAALEAFDDIVLSKRPRAIERGTVKLCNQAAQLLHRPRTRQGPAVDVIVEVERVLLDPDGVVDAYMAS